MGLAELVARLRLAHEPPLTQAALASQIGAPDSYIAHIESGRLQTPTPDRLRGLARALGVSVVDLLAAAGYISNADLDMPEVDEAYRAQLRLAAGIRDARLRRIVARTIAELVEVDRALQSSS